MNIFLKKHILTACTTGLFALVIFFLFVTHAFGATPEFVPLTGLPGLQDLDKNTPISTYINAVYLTIIAIGALIGVVRLAMAGVKYSLDDIVTRKQDAKDDIKGVLLGLAILLIPYIVLYTIYPGLTNLNVLSNAPKVNLGTEKSVGRVYNDASNNSLQKNPGDVRKAQEAGDNALNPNRVQNWNLGCAGMGMLVSPDSAEREMKCQPASKDERRQNCENILKGTWVQKYPPCILPSN